MVSCRMLLRQSVARLIAAPMFTAFSVLSLAAGVAVTTAVYSVVDSLFLSDLGIADPDRVAFVTTDSGGTGRGGTVSDLDFEDVRDAQTTLRSMSATTAIFPLSPRRPTPRSSPPKRLKARISQPLAYQRGWGG